MLSQTEDYEKLKNFICEKEPPLDKIILDLQAEYSNQLKPRKASNCLTIIQLLKVLERLAILSEDDVQCLYKIHKYVEGLEGMLHDYENRYRENFINNSEGVKVNFYAEQRRKEEALEKEENIRAEQKNRELDSYYQTPNSNNDTPKTAYINPYAPYHLDDEKRNKIYKHIGKHIGRYWRDFGRELKMVEGEMDDLEGQKNKISDRIPIMLDMFAEQCETDRFAVNICVALLKAGQTKLSKDVQRTRVDSIKNGNSNYVNPLDRSNYSKNREIILNKCCKYINQHGWRKFASCLKIRECDIDRLDNEYGSSRQNEQLVKEIITLFENSCDQQKIIPLLLDALEESGHQYLRDQIKALMK